MNLHLDKDAFRVLIEDIHSKTGYRTDVLEKDYYVLRESDQIVFDTACESMKRLHERLLQNAAWKDYDNCNMFRHVRYVNSVL